jgi:sugar lactone lactonase YvrE
VSEFGNNRIQRFSPEGKPMGIFGMPGRLPGMFANPWDIAIDKEGKIYVADALNHRVQRLSPKIFNSSFQE